MKIKTLRLKNINALAGDWQIDFDHNEFYSQGIFAILGATGAGKTTILDAICLAIYGATPRLGKISKSDNALMTIGTAECLASVELLLDKKYYRFDFAQRRAKGLLDGALQEPKHEIYEMINDKFILISEKKSHSEKLAIELLRMDFTQFTRSVMLAQGGFSVFLQSKPEERGEILEKITGTDIYAKIGAKVFAVFKQKEQILKEKKDKLSDICIISDDELNHLKLSIENSNYEKDHIDNKIKEISNKISLINQYHQLKNDYEKNNQLLIQSSVEIKNFEPNISKLEKHNHYNHLLPVYNQMVFLKNQSDELLRKKMIIDNKLSELNNDFLVQESVVQSLQNSLDSANQSYSDWQPKLIELKKMTDNIDRLLSDKDTIQHAINEGEEDLLKFNEKLLDYQNLLKNHDMALKNIEDFLETFKLIKMIDGDVDFGVPILNFSHETEKLIGKVNALIWGKDEIKNLEISIEEINHLLKKEQKIFDEKKLKVDEIFYKLSTNLNTNNELDFFLNLNNLKLNLDNQRDLYKNFSDFINKFQKINLRKCEYDTQSNQLKECQNQLSIKQDKLNEDNNRLIQLKNEYNLLLKNYELRSEINKLNDYIDLLTEGNACPLCGSTHHPYTHNPPKLDDDIKLLKLQVNDKNDEIVNYEQKLKNDEMEVIELNSQIKHEINSLMKLKEEIQINNNDLLLKWKDICARINYLGISNDFNQLNDEYLILVKDRLKQDGIDTKNKYEDSYDAFMSYQNYSLLLNESKSVLEKLSEKLAFNHNQLENSKKYLESCKSELNPIFSQLFHIINHIRNFFDTYAAIINQIHKDDFDFQFILSAFDTMVELGQLFFDGVNQDNLTRLSQLNHDIVSGIDLVNLSLLKFKEMTYFAISHYNQQMVEQQKIGHSIKELSEKISENNLILNDQNKKINQLKEELLSVNNVLIGLNRKKLEKFGNINANEKEKYLIDEIQSCKENFAGSTHKLQLIKQDIIGNKSLLDNINLEQKSSKELLLNHEHEFNNKLLENFVDLEEFLKSKLEDNDVIDLKNNYDKLLDNLQKVQVIVEKNKKDLSDILNAHHDIEEWDFDGLKNSYHALRADLENLLSEFGSNMVLYQQAMDNKEKQSQLFGEIHNLEKNLMYYQLLNQLIGSSDGKKYRNFAQRLTLESLLEQANMVLVKMSDRYRLVASNDEKNLLGIEVIDHYQADKVRQSKNLSGGESFMVSLALALGLSAMSSQNMQIDSLFLDEGFGTLDENALDIALTALSEIQATGKMIGVISHIGVLKERIGTQILVHKKSGGKSELSGVGVRRIA